MYTKHYTHIEEEEEAAFSPACGQGRAPCVSLVRTNQDLKKKLFCRRATLLNSYWIQLKKIELSVLIL